MMSEARAFGKNEPAETTPLTLPSESLHALVVADITKDVAAARPVLTERRHIVQEQRHIPAAKAKLSEKVGMDASGVVNVRLA